MKCRKCNEKAIIKLYEHNLPLCRKHFIEFFENRVKKAINDFKMPEGKERVLVAISGGKDSLTLAYVLKKFGYNISLLHVNVGIKNYSEKSLEFSKKFSEEFDLPLKVISLKEEWGESIEDASKRTYKSICSLCGMVKRYYFNKVGYEEKFDAVATGHNLDDASSALLSNILGWRVSYISKQGPVLPSEGKLRKRIKPLIYLTEREIAAYAFINKINFLMEGCPHSKYASFLRIKHILNEIEVLSPGTKFSFYSGFLKNIQIFKERKEVKLKECEICGYPTTGRICSFCKTFRKSATIKENGSKVSR